MNVSDAAQAAHNAASAAMTGGVGTAVGSGLAMAWSPSQWQVIGIVGGLVIGFLGLVVKTVVDIYFKAQHLKLAQSRAAVLKAMSDED